MWPQFGHSQRRLPILVGTIRASLIIFRLASFTGKGWFVRKILLTTALLSALLAAPAAHASGEQVTYQVQSDGPIMSVSYFDAINDIQIQQNLPSSWSQTINSRSTYQLHTISTQTTGTQITCQIQINGQVIDEKSATGRYATVVCSG